jgi:hypothetical protein
MEMMEQEQTQIIVNAQDGSSHRSQRSLLTWPKGILSLLKLRRTLTDQRALKDSKRYKTLDCLAPNAC